MVTRRFIDIVIKDKGWEPYIKSHWMDIRHQKAGVVIGFRGHTLEYACSHDTAREILSLNK